MKSLFVNWGRIAFVVLIPGGVLACSVDTHSSFSPGGAGSGYAGTGYAGASGYSGIIAGGEGGSGAAGAAGSGSGGQGANTCGNGVLDANNGEQCDGVLLGGETCSSLGHSGGTLLCDPSTCTYDTSMCRDLDSGYGSSGSGGSDDAGHDDAGT